MSARKRTPIQNAPTWPEGVHSMTSEPDGADGYQFSAWLHNDLGGLSSISAGTYPELLAKAERLKAARYADGRNP